MQTIHIHKKKDQNLTSTNTLMKIINYNKSDFSNENEKKKIMQIKKKIHIYKTRGNTLKKYICSAHEKGN